MSELEPLLGLSRHQRQEKVPLREFLRGLFRRRKAGAPAPRLPRPSANVLARRTLASRPEPDES